jgi:hypothetical protein
MIVSLTDRPIRSNDFNAPIGATYMWEQITPADIERAKAAWTAMRDKILARHQEEIKILEMDGNLLRSLETGLMAFHQRFMSPPQLTAVSAETPLSTDAQVADQLAPLVGEKATVVTLPTSPKPGEPGPAGDNRGPNFLEQARRWTGGKASPAAKSDLSVGD